MGQSSTSRPSKTLRNRASVGYHVAPGFGHTTHPAAGLGSLDPAGVRAGKWMRTPGSPRGTLMTLSNRGAARVGVVWLVVVGVLMLVAITFAAVTQSDLTKARQAVADANKAKDDAVKELETANTTRRDLSQLLGWYDRESADPAA